MNVVNQIRSLLRDLFQWWVSISPWQQGVRVRLGKHTKLLMPGVHLKLPIIDTVYMQPIRVRAQHVTSQTLSTRDGKAVALASAVHYEITDLLELYRTLHNAHDTIEQHVQGLLAYVVFRKKLAELTPGDVEREVREALDLECYGLAVRGFYLTSFCTARTYRLISGDMGTFTSYDQRLETTRPIGHVEPH